MRCVRRDVLTARLVAGPPALRPAPSLLQHAQRALYYISVMFHPVLEVVAASLATYYIEHTENLSFGMGEFVVGSVLKSFHSQATDLTPTRERGVTVNITNIDIVMSVSIGRPRPWSLCVTYHQIRTESWPLLFFF